MSKWTRIGDDAYAPFGKRTIPFPVGEALYFVAVDESDQDNILVTYDAAARPWGIEYKETNGAVFRLSGFTWGRGDPHWDEKALGHWFELTLTARSTLRYWGDRVVLHEDVEAEISN